MLGGNSGGQPISKVLFADFIGRSPSRSCEVCGQTHSNEGNVLVTCKNCNLVVHQKCYGEFHMIRVLVAATAFL